MLCHELMSTHTTILQYLNNHAENKYDIYAVPENFVLEQLPTPATKYFTVGSTISALAMIYGEITTSTYTSLQYPVLPKQFATNHPEIVDMWFQFPKLRLQHKLELGYSLARNTTTNQVAKKSTPVEEEKETNLEKNMKEKELCLQTNTDIFSVNTTSSGESRTEEIPVKEIQGDGITAQLARKTQGKRAGRPKKG